MDLCFPYGLCLCTVFPSANPKLLHMARRDTLVQEWATEVLAYEINSQVHQLTW